MSENSDGGKPRRSAGMRGHPRQALPEHRPVSSTPPILPPEPAPTERVSTSRFIKPKMLMGEVTMPIQKLAASRTGGQQIAKQRESFRAFMLAHHLRPTDWARKAGIPTGEILSFLAGTARNIAPASLEKLARAAGCTAQDLMQ